MLRAIQERNRGRWRPSTLPRSFGNYVQLPGARAAAVCAFLGPEGTYSQAAALKHFGQSAIPQGQASIHKVFRQVEERLCDYGVVPVENSTEGMVGQTLDCFLESPLQITGRSNCRSYTTSSQVGCRAIRYPVDSGSRAGAGAVPAMARQSPAESSREAVASNGEAARRAGVEAGVAGIAGELAAGLHQLDTLRAPYRTAPPTPHDFWCWAKR